MTTLAACNMGSEARQTPVRNLRICFWGVQGSCPMFPEPHEVADYTSLVVRDTIRRVMQDIRRKGNGAGMSAEQLLGGIENDDSLAAYQTALAVAELPVYGGETTCVSIETGDGHTILIDGGSGIRNASKHMIRDWGDRPREITVFTTHEHLDHRSGLPFCQFCFARPAFAIRIYGTGPVLTVLDQHYGLFSREVTAHMNYDDPVDFRVMAAQFDGVEIFDAGAGASPANGAVEAGNNGGVHAWTSVPPDQPIAVGRTTVIPFDVYHGLTRCVAYKILHGPASFVFCTDHELRHGPDPDDPRQRRSEAAEERLHEHCRGVDLAYFDGQYLMDEYLGRRGIGVTVPVSRIDWGHGCIEDCIRRARACGARRALIGHHDPERCWQERVELDRRLAGDCDGTPCQIELAKSYMVIDL